MRCVLARRGSLGLSRQRAQPLARGYATLGSGSSVTAKQQARLQRSVLSDGGVLEQLGGRLCYSGQAARNTSNLSCADMLFTRALLLEKEAMIIDCDGVLYHGDKLLPGAKAFVDFLKASGKRFLFLTNSSDKSAAQLVRKFADLGLETEERDFFTSAMATATFLRQQKRGGRAYVVGKRCLADELRRKEVTVLDEREAEMSTPDFVVVGEAAGADLYNFEHIEFAVKMVRRGARLIGTNEDVADRLGNELQPGTGALILPVEAASGYQAYHVGKPNPLMIRSALDILGVDRGKAVMIGDRMNTDVKAGVEAGVDTVLVLSGVCSEQDILRFAYRPSTVLSGVGDIAAILNESSPAYAAPSSSDEPQATP